MITRYDNVVVDIICRAMAPFILLFALYVITHGHYSPGGGFQGGAIMAASVMLLRLSLGKARTRRMFSSRLALILGAVGLLIYVGTGLLALIWGGMFLEYAHLPIPGLTDAYLRYYGIQIVEIGIALAVFGILVSIFDSLVEA